MRTALPVVVAVTIGLPIACTSSRAPDPDAEPVVAAPALSDPNAPLSLAGATPSSRAAFRSPPRDTWACALDVDERQGSFAAHGRATFVYGKRERCLLPVDVVALGIFGCPDSIERRDTDGSRSTKHAKYDAAGRLVELESNGAVVNRYSWIGDRLDAVTRSQWGTGDHARYLDAGADVVAVDDAHKPQQLFSFGADRLVRDVEYMYGRPGGTATITWSGSRPLSVQVTALSPASGSVSRRFAYDCAP